MKLPPACLFPTTTIFLDDHEDFLASLLRSLRHEQAILKGFTCYKKAKHHLETIKSLSNWKNSWLKAAPSENNFENLSIEIQFSKILEVIFDPSRFDIVTTIVVDYQMPGINGLEFLREISETPAKKILLTGIADADIAIEAMEQGLIDSYLKKHDKHLTSKLKETIQKHRVAYFSHMTSIINDSLNIISTSESIDKAYCQLIECLKNTHHATEYYLIDQNGSYTFINQDGYKLDLIIKSKQQLEAEFDEAKDHIKDIDTLGKLWNFELMLHPKRLGKTNLLNTIPLDNKHEVYYAVSEDIFNIDLKRIASYRNLVKDSLA